MLCRFRIGFRRFSWLHFISLTSKYFSLKLKFEIRLNESIGYSSIKTDYLHNIEYIVATNYNDVIIGDYLDGDVNVIFALDGEDQIIPRLGNDFIDGGNGFDYITVYEKYGGTYITNLGSDPSPSVNSSVTFSTGEIDEFINIEGFICTQYPDVNLAPWVNNCTIYGLFYKFKFLGREGNDIFIYSSYTGCSLYGETSL